MLRVYNKPIRTHRKVEMAPVVIFSRYMNCHQSLWPLPHLRGPSQLFKDTERVVVEWFEGDGLGDSS